MIPLNWALIGFCGMTGAVLAQIGLRDHDPQALLFVVPLFLVGLPFLISTLKRDTFFQSQDAPPISSLVAARSEAALFETQFGFTGKLRLHEKEARRFLDVPARATRLENGALAFVSNIDASTRFSGVVTKSKVGLWLCSPQFESAPIECGTLFYGKKSRPALRVQFLETADAKNARLKAILSFDDITSREAMRTFLLAQMGSTSSTSSQSASPFSSSTG
ncbi:hypothetical protein B1R32_102108 [Abditibacterium utsteinense]|uniref:Uncharacterized protein n=2 Tax=Abditibacterium utsteinense TaxID=1960156 RepID=A0A2S8SWB6_9BACT|nr:hypothetical protein B1R32_102108 [Abditibacterium utsteinense]